MAAESQRLVLATHNRHKVVEVGRILAPRGILIEPLPADVELPPEVGNTFAANALDKARAAAALTGRPAIGDDSGIEAEVLGGRPGVRSARYAGPAATGEQNLARLIAEVSPGSGLRYVCVVAYVEPGGEGQLFHGSCSGRMSAERRGERGFGYDPVFLPDEGTGQRTMAELTEPEKDEISHRGRAVRALAAWLSP
ncbi:MAG TPA: RdgB/HAM1 family non-canonical purine NTP pyrophosphatase [Solirubrobacteraceae bacterium]|nr:RdgB/HAM1 family non-canonical purine NTP pyrophosphatase [Solirubrobacteraceae bacterium]